MQVIETPICVTVPSTINSNFNSKTAGKNIPQVGLHGTISKKDSIGEISSSSFSSLSSPQPSKTSSSTLEHGINFTPLPTGLNRLGGHCVGTKVSPDLDPIHKASTESYNVPEYNVSLSKPKTDSKPSSMLSLTSPITSATLTPSVMEPTNDTKSESCITAAVANKSASIPVFQHILLLPLSYIPSNCLTSEEEAEQKRKVWNIRRKKAIEARREAKKRKYTEAQNYDFEDDQEIGRSAEMGGNPNFVVEHMMENSNQNDDTADNPEYQPPYCYETDFDENLDDDDSDDNDDDVFLPDDGVDNSISSEDNLSKQKQLKRNYRVKYSNDAEGDISWNKQIESLKRFKETYGHTKVSQRKADDLELAKWVKKVREKYKRAQKGIAVPTLSQERIAQLNALGFVWMVKIADSNENFEHHFANLIKFGDEHNHTRVPHVYDKNPKLGRWCHNIKLSYKKIEKGEKPMIKIQQEHIDKLNAIGFQWKIRHVVASTKENNQDNFDELLKKLATFIGKYGHSNVSHDTGDNNLACWVSSLKSSYRQIHEGKRPIIRLSENQITQLNELDFDWSDKSFETRSVQTNTSFVAWNERYKQLCDYKKMYGNCRVPGKYDDDKAFGNWVSLQRSALGAKIVKGKKSSLTNEQQQKLEAVGLEWTVYKMEKVKQKHSNNFEKHVNELKEFYAQHGHFLIPREDKTLFNWVQNVRYAYKYKEEGRPVRMALSEERILTLANLGFDFSLKKRLTRKKRARNTCDLLQPALSPKRQRLSMNKWVKDLGLGFVLEDKRVKHEFGLKQASMTSWCMNLKLGFTLEGIHAVENNTSIVTRGIRKQFKDYVEELRIYKAQHGHIAVTPKVNKSLSAWISNIRMSYKRIQEGKSALIKLSPERRKMLESIDFDFRSRIRLKKRIPAKKVSSNIQCIDEPLLVENKSSSLSLVQGSTKKSDKRKPTVQSLYSPKRLKLQESSALISMNDWVKNLGLGFVVVQVKEPTILNQPLMSNWFKELNIGFIFEGKSEKKSAGTTKQNRVPRKRFENYVEELRIFKEKHGDIKITAKTNKSLNAWISNIKMSYKRILSGEKPLIHLSSERMVMLENVGFDWSRRRRSKHAPSKEPFRLPPVHVGGEDPVTNIKSERAGLGSNSKPAKNTAIKLQDQQLSNTSSRKTFDERIAELEAFREIHGHMKLTQVYNTNKALGNWCRNVRTSYSRIKKGQPLLGLRLSSDKIARLEAIGFKFSLKSVDGKKDEQTLEGDEKKSEQTPEGDEKKGEQILESIEVYTNQNEPSETEVAKQETTPKERICVWI